jgi:tRNA A58 N-methylase Trm61
VVAAILRNGRHVPDDAFDEIYPEVVRRVSSVHWTPVRVCARIVALLALPPGARILDVGAGVGKFCIVAAAMTRARVRGIERHPELAEVGREAARRFGIEVDIGDGNFDGTPVESVDAAYFFNPFSETDLLPGVAHATTPEGVAEDVAAAEKFLAGARVGARIVTYCGFGGRIPDDYERLAHEAWEGGALEVWEKRSASAARHATREVTHDSPREAQSAPEGDSR